MSREIERIVINEQRQFSQAIQEATAEQVETKKRAERTPTSKPISTDLPNIYRPKDIPLSILLCNYVFLLARKPKNMAIFFLVVLITGLMAIVGPAPMAASVVEMSALITSKTSDKDLPWAMPKTVERPVLSSSDVPAYAKFELEILSDAATEAHELDTVTVSDPAIFSEHSSSVSIEELVQEDPHTQAEQINHGIVALPETLAEQAVDGEDVADEATQPQSPEMVASSEPTADSGRTESTSVESVQPEQSKDQIILEKSDKVGIETEAPVAREYVEMDMTSPSVTLEHVDVEMTSITVAPIDVEVEVTSNFMEEAPDSPQIEQGEKSAPQSFLSGSPALCSLVDEEDDENNDRFMASSPSHVGQMHRSSPYSVLSEQQETCKF